MKQLILIGAFCIACLGSLSGARMIVLGDSLSDGGYYFGIRFTDSGGLLWHEYLADRLSYDRATISRSIFGETGLNLAVGGSLVSDLQSQANRLAGRYTAQPGDLCTLWIGGNDIRGNPNQNMPLLADEIGDIIGQLNALGIDRLIVPNLPDLGAIPESPSSYTRAERTAGTIAFNTALAAELEVRALAHSMQIDLLDVFSLFDQMLFYSADYGFVNVTDPLDGTGNDPDTYAFWDDIHPTTRSHYLISAATYAIVEPLAPIELVSQSIFADGTLRQTWLADPAANYDIISGVDLNHLDQTDSFLGSPAYTVEIPPTGSRFRLLSNTSKLALNPGASDRPNIEPFGQDPAPSSARSGRKDPGSPFSTGRRPSGERRSTCSPRRPQKSHSR